MTNKIRALVLGNCTIYSIAQALEASGLFEVAKGVVFSMSDAERNALASKVNDYDFVVSLEHANWAGPLATTVLRERLSEKLITLPTPFFSGLFPDMAYLKYEKAISRCQSVLGDYHSALILEEIKSGIVDEEIVQRYVSGESFNRLNLNGIWNDSLEELKKRESRTDIKLSDFIERTIENKTIVSQFLTFNHPAEGLINHIATNAIHLITGKWLDKPLITREQHGLNSGVRWPLHPAVAASLSLPFSGDTRFRRPLGLRATAKEEWIEMENFVRQSVTFFAQYKNLDRFEISAPHYLQKYIETKAKQ